MKHKTQSKTGPTETGSMPVSVGTDQETVPAFAEPLPAGQETVCAETEPQREAEEMPPAEPSVLTEKPEPAVDPDPDETDRPDTQPPDRAASSKADGVLPGPVWEDLQRRLTALARARGEAPEALYERLTDGLTALATGNGLGSTASETPPSSAGSLRSAEPTIPPERSAFIRSLWRR